jgi:hypothetical protein
MSVEECAEIEQMSQTRQKGEQGSPFSFCYSDLTFDPFGLAEDEEDFTALPELRLS